MENTLHSPFLCHLFTCCGGDYDEFANTVNDQIERKIEEIYKEIYDDVSRRKIENSGRSIISSRFRKFVEGKEKCHENKKNPKYCMLEFYKHIAKINQDLMLSSDICDTVIQSDIELLERFMAEFDYYRDRNAVAVNKKRLQDFFKYLKEGKALNDDLEYLFDYLLKIFFPEFQSEHGENLLERIKFKPWEEAVFGNHKHHEFIKNTSKNDVRYEKIINLFKNLNDATSGKTMDIRETLLEISNLLDGIYYSIYNEQDQDESRINLIEEDSIEEGNISELHSHILAFMRWIPMMSQDKPNKKIMESVDNVIDQIRVRAHEIIDSKDSLKQSLNTYPTSCHDIVFMQDDGIELRRLLIKAMCCEHNICLQFKYFYGEDISNEGKGEVSL